jgi:hypothetical protein
VDEAEQPEPSHVVRSPEDSLGSPSAQLPNEPTGPSDGPDRRGLVIVTVLAVVVIAGIVAWSIGRRDASDAIARDEERFPSPTTLAAPTTATLASTVPASPVTVPETPPQTAPPPPPTTPAPTLPPTTPAPTAPPTVATTIAGVPAATLPPGVGTTTLPPPTDPDIIGQLVPNLAAYTQFLTTPEQAKVEIDQLLASGRHDVAMPGPAATICAAVRMDQPLAVNSRWERDGRRIASSDLGRRDAPGFGECLGNDGEPLEDGSYQYVAIDSEGHESAAGGIVVGATRLDQVFTNSTNVPVCAIRVAPSVSRYFEVYVYAASPIVRGGSVTLPVADVGQDVETVGCKGGETDDVLARFSFDPQPGVAQPLKP